MLSVMMKHMYPDNVELPGWQNDHSLQSISSFISVTTV